jgi:NAD(P)-dependent dehydrogenase (short-subunit alcohol dehydrogenase family)
MQAVRRDGTDGRRTALLLAAGAAGAVLAVRTLRTGSYRLEGRTVLITGGSRGLGLVLAREAAAQGARVAICARDQDTLERARETLSREGAAVVGANADVTDRGSVVELIRKVTEHLGPIDVLINNAGVIEVGPADTMSVHDYEEAMATNFWGMLYPTLEVLPSMRSRREGRIVNITSIGGKLGIPHLLPYSASKFAAVGFSQGLRAELASDGVKVVTVVPGLMRTGSPRHAIFRGKHRAEYAWFSIADSLPGLSISAESAARRILSAARRGDAEVLFPLTARAAAVINAVAPDLTAGALSLTARLLPESPDESTGRRKGEASQSWLSPSWLTRLGERAARRNNQLAPAEARAP